MHNDTELLIITDQKNSSKHLTHEVKPRTKRHFEDFIKALPQTASVVKNIGDSLMIRVTLKNAKDLPHLLKTILEAQQGLATRSPSKPTETPIRVLVMKLDKEEYLDGKAIGYSDPPKRKAKIRPFPRAGAGHWLEGDLFGPNIALAFRASAVPSEAIVVVQDEAAKLLSDYREGVPFSTNVGSARLYFGPALAFSPFRGLQEIYKFAGEGPYVGSWWCGHLYLRMIHTDEKKVQVDDTNATNALVLDQQKARIFTELVWLQKETDVEVAKWKDQLSKAEGKAGYIRSLARIQESYRFPQKDLSSPKTGYGLVAIGAYPNQEAYASIRASVEQIKKISGTNFAYPVTTEVYVPENSAEAATAFWSSPRVLDKYVLMFGSWVETARLNSAETAKLAIHEAICTKYPSLTLVRCGLTVGGLWDVYAILEVANGFPKAEKDIEELFKNSFDALTKQCFATASFRVCQDLRSTIT